uniref:MauE/DoxX family redox-associated membrane protein n=1 Tax=Pedobacter heparinus TaxID=984 RepID=UPI003977C927
MKAKIIVINTCTVLLVLLFFYTALSKVLEYEKFIFQMRLSPLVLMQRLAPVIGVLVILAELLVVWALLWPGWEK